MKKIALITFVFLSGLTTAFTQEICNNAIDDDGDGWIDQDDCECNIGPASNRGNIWHFGTGFALDFNDGEPIQFSGSSMISFEGCATICNEDGEILAYSNGGGRLPSALQFPGSIWNANNDEMYDMMGTEGGGSSAVQSSVFVPKPGSNSNYYLFTMEEVEFNVDGEIPDQPNGRGLTLFEIDMTLNGGLGGVVNADERLFVPSFESVAAIEHENEEDYWVIIANGDSPELELVVFLASSSGVELVDSYTFPSIQNTFNYIKISPKKDRIVLNTIEGLSSFSFDPATGVIGNLQNTDWENLLFGDFSASGRYFYGVTINFMGLSFVQRIDFESPNNPIELEDVGDIEVDAFLFGQMQLGPDGNVYFRTDQTILSRIECADTPFPTVVSEFMELIPTPNTPISITFGLPNFPNNFFFRPPYEEIEFLSPNMYEFCDGESLEITVETNKCVEFEWSTGETTASISVNAPGTYTVTLTDDCTEVIENIEVTGDGISSFETDAPSAVCAGEMVTISVINLGANVTVNWFDIQGNLVAENIFEGILNTNTTLLAEVITDCGEITQQVTIEVEDTPEIQLETSLANCNENNGTAVLSNPNPDWVIEWQDEFGNIIGTTEELSNLAAGIYSILVTNSASGLGCNSSQEFTIEENNAPEITLINQSSLLCPEDTDASIQIEISGGESPYDIRWEDEFGNTISNELLANNLGNGVYNVGVTDANDCSVSASFVIEAPTLSIPSLTSNDAFCDNENGSILFTAIDPDDQIFLNGQLTPENELSQLFAGDYALQVQNGDDCLLIDTIVNIGNSFPFDIAGDTTYIITEGDRIQIELPFPTEGLIFDWKPNQFLSCNDCPNPLASPIEDIVYVIEVIDPLTECSDFITIQIEVEPPVNIYIPNAFSPNDDGFNDLFTIFPSDPRVVINQFQVLDRWGGLVYESDNNEAAWDGKKNGNPLGTGVFVYLIEIQLPNGETVLRKGDIALVR